MTIVLRVIVNGEEFVIAGEASMSVLSAHVTAAGQLGPETKNRRGRQRTGPHIDLSVGGMTSRGDRRKDEHLRWGSRKQLVPGDKVTIEILDSNTYQSPTNRHPVDISESRGIAARSRWLRAQKLYLRLRDKFEMRTERLEARVKRQFLKTMRRKR